MRTPQMLYNQAEIENALHLISRNSFAIASKPAMDSGRRYTNRSKSLFGASNTQCEWKIEYRLDKLKPFVITCFVFIE